MWGLSIPSLFLLLTLPLGTTLMGSIKRYANRKVSLANKAKPIMVTIKSSIKNIEEELVLPQPYICNHYNLKRRKC